MSDTETVPEGRKRGRPAAKKPAVPAKKAAPAEDVKKISSQYK